MTEVLLLQPNIDPYNEKYEKNNRYFFDLMVEMLSKQITKKTRYIFTPETYFASGLGEPLNDFESSQLYYNLDSLLQLEEEMPLRNLLILIHLIFLNQEHVVLEIILKKNLLLVQRKFFLIRHNC